MQLENEKGKDCLALQKIGARADGRKTVKLSDIVAPFRIFLHADPSSPKSPLIAFEGITGVRATGSRSYENRWTDETESLLNLIVAGNKVIHSTPTK